jgi:hypothetical protein
MFADPGITLWWPGCRPRRRTRQGSFGTPRGMADYVRRRIAPLLPGLDAEYLELIVGELEIATETRQVGRNH